MIINSLNKEINYNIIINDKIPEFIILYNNDENMYDYITEWYYNKFKKIRIIVFWVLQIKIIDELKYNLFDNIVKMDELILRSSINEAKENNIILDIKSQNIPFNI